MQYKSLIIRGGKIPAKIDPSAKTTRPDRPSVRPRTIFRWIWIWILFYFIFSSFRTDNGFGIFFRVSTRPARPFINNIKKKKSHIRIHPTPPNHFFLSQAHGAHCWPDHLSLFSHFHPPHSLSNSPHIASFSLYDHISAKKKNKRSKKGGVSLGLARGSRLGWETNWTKATPWLEASIPNPICLFSTFLVLWLPDLVISCTVVARSGEILPDLERKWVCVCAWVCSVCDLSFGIKFLTILFVFVIKFVWYNFFVL